MNPTLVMPFGKKLHSLHKLAESHSSCVMWQKVSLPAQSLYKLKKAHSSRANAKKAHFLAVQKHETLLVYSKNHCTK